MTNKPHEHFFWLDLETTGSSDDAKIVEIGAAITNQSLRVLDARTYVMHTEPQEWDSVADVVRDMHTKNNLIRDSLSAYLTIATVDSAIANWIKQYNGTNHMAFCGSGVSHFDRKFIKRDMPKTDKALTYWAIDIGSARRAYHYFGGHDDWLPDAKTHRAIDDVYYHIDEMKYLVSRFKEGE